MTTIFELVDTALATLSPAVPFAWDQYLTDSNSVLPDVFMVASLITDDPAQHADNSETERLHRIQISQYSRSGLISLPDVDSVMKAAGFAKSNRIKLPFDPDTGHFGLATDYTILRNSN